MESIILALIAIIPTSATCICNYLQNRVSKKDAAKQSILMMIMEDEFQYSVNGRIPTNYQNILHDFDIYTKNSGNSYVKERVDDYCTWYEEISKKGPKKGQKSPRPIIYHLSL